MWLSSPFQLPKISKAGHIKEFAKFRQRLALLGLSHLLVLQPMLYLDITFWDWSLWPDAAMEATERQIHSILFPNVEFAWEDFCRANGISPVPNNPKGQQPGDDLPEDAVARAQFRPNDGHDGGKHEQETGQIMCQCTEPMWRTTSRRRFVPADPRVVHMVDDGDSCHESPDYLQGRLDPPGYRGNPDGQGRERRCRSVDPRPTAWLRYCDRARDRRRFRAAEEDRAANRVAKPHYAGCPRKSRCFAGPVISIVNFSRPISVGPVGRL